MIMIIVSVKLILSVWRHDVSSHHDFAPKEENFNSMTAG